VRKDKEPRRRLVITLKGVNDYRWVVNIMSHIGATNYTQAIRALLFTANKLIELDVNPLSAPDLIKEYRRMQSKVDGIAKELTKVVEVLNSIPKNQQVININGETVNIGMLADKIENITNMIRQLNETLTVKQNISIAVYSHERNEIKSTVIVLANIVNAILSNTVFEVERGRWTNFDNELIMRRDAIEKIHRNIQKIVSRLEKQHNTPLEELIPKATPANRIWLEMLDDASDLVNLMLEYVTVPQQLRDSDMRRALYEKMKQYLNKYRAYALSERK
jgi:hypothetical protein